MMNLQERLRAHACELRRTSMPLSTLIPLLTQTADKLDELEMKLERMEFLYHEALQNLEGYY